MPIIDVAVPVPLRQTFSYTSEQKLQPGVRVSVPFGRRQLIGVVTASYDDPVDDTESEVKLKAVTEVLDEQPLFDATLQALTQWLATYYHHPIGEVWATVMPTRLRKGGALSDSVPALTLTDAGQAEAQTPTLRGKKQLECIALLAQGPLATEEIKTKFSNSTLM